MLLCAFSPKKYDCNNASTVTAKLSATKIAQIYGIGRAARTKKRIGWVIKLQHTIAAIKSRLRQANFHRKQ